jgi:DNA-binding transcriptional LysR family regulator
VAENIDCAIRSTADDPMLVTRPIGRLRWTTCASPAYLAKYGTPKHPRDVVARKMPVVGYFSASSGLRQPLRLGGGDTAFTLEDLRCDVLVSESNAHLATALAGLGIVNTMEFMVRPAIESGLLVPILEKWRPDPLQVYLVYPASRRYSTKVRVFVDWTAALFGEL